MQLVAYGAQDVYLSGTPQITFFKVVYRRHTNFSVEPIPQTWNGSADFGRTVTCNVNRNGDLITNMYVWVQLKSMAQSKAAWGYVRRLGHAMINYVRIEIGGSQIDQQYGDWLNIWYELTHKVGQERGYAKMIGDVAELKRISTDAKPSYQMYVPLQFWFNRNNGLALPLIALQYHDVRMTVVFNPASQCVNYVGASAPLDMPAMTDCNLLIDYVYLDSEERKRFAQNAHEYLIEQLQFTGSETAAMQNKYRLNFNHPSKYVVWALHSSRFFNPNAEARWLAHAENGDWHAARDRFAKLLAAVTASGFKYDRVARTIVINNDVQNLVAGDVVEVTADVNVNNDLAALLAKIDVKFVVKRPDGSLSSSVASSLGVSSSASSTDVSSTTYNSSLHEVKYPVCIATGNDTNAAGVTSNLFGNNGAFGTTHVLTDLVNNGIVARNELTLEDMNLNILELAGLLNIGNSSNGVLGGSISTLKGLSDPANRDQFLSDVSVYVSDHFNYGNKPDGSDNPTWSAKLQLNGHDRFQDRDGNYFNYVQPYQHWSNTPADGINSYSFALKPEDHQPTGTCNFSRIDNATLLVSLGEKNAPAGNSTKYNAKALSGNPLMNIYTVNYNVLRVMSGMAGTAYSN